MAEQQLFGRRSYILTPEFSKAYPVLRRMANMLLSGALVVCLNQVASVLALGLKTHMEPSFDPLVSLQPELCALPRGHYRSS